MYLQLFKRTIHLKKANNNSSSLHLLFSLPLFLRLPSCLSIYPTLKLSDVIKDTNLMPALKMVQSGGYAGLCPSQGSFFGMHCLVNL